MGLFDTLKNLAGKATDLAGEHSETISGGLDRVGEIANERFGENEHIDSGIQAIQDKLDETQQ